MTKLTLRNITGNDPYELDVKKNYFISNYDADASNLEDALDAVERGLKDLKAFLLVVGTSRSEYFYNIQMPTANLDFGMETDTYYTIAIENPYVLPAVLLGKEAQIISTDGDAYLFNNCDITRYNGNEEEIIVSPPLTGPSPETIQLISEAYGDFCEVDLSKGDINTILTFLFNKIRIPIEAQPGKPVVLKLRQFLDALAVNFVGESKESRCPHLLNYYDEPYRLDPKEWCMSCVTRMTHGELTVLGSDRIGPLHCDPVPYRDVAHPEVVRDMCNFFKGSDEPTYPDWLKDMLAAAPSGPNEGQTPPQNPTASRSIGISSNSEGTNTAHNLPEVLTDADHFWANMKKLIRSEVNAALRAKSDNKGGVTKSRARSTPLTQTPNRRRDGGDSVTPAQRPHFGTHRAAYGNGWK